MLQGWIEWAKVCKLTILHDLATFYLGVLIITMSPVDIVMTRGSLFLFITFLQMLSKPCLSLSFAFVSKAKCLLLLLLPPPCHDQDHLHIAWGWDEPPSPLLCPSFSFLLASTSVIHMMIWVFFPPPPPSGQILFPHGFFPSFTMPFYDFISTWDGLHCVRGLCVCASSLLLNAIWWL